MRVWRKRTGRASVWRTLFPVFLLLIAVSVLVVAVRFVKMAPILILPEERLLRAEMFASPDNGYPLIMEAVELLQKLSPDGESRFVYDQPVSLALCIGLTCTDDSKDFNEFLKACAPAAEKTQQALRKPYILWNKYSYWNGYKEWRQIVRLAAVLTAQGEAAFREEGCKERCLEKWRDALRLQDIIQSCGYGLLENTRLFRKTYDLCRRAAEKASPEDLDRFASMMTALGTPCKDRAEALKNEWRLLDNAQREPLADNNQSFRHNLWLRYAKLRFRSRAKVIIPQIPVCLELVKGNLRELKDWKEKNGLNTPPQTRPAFHPIWDVELVLRNVLPHIQEYNCTVLVIALQRFRAAHGGYPERLDALIPNFLLELPRDAFNGAEYRYHLDQDRFVLSTDRPRFNNSDPEGEEILYPDSRAGQ